MFKSMIEKIKGFFNLKPKDTRTEEEKFADELKDTLLFNEYDELGELRERSLPERLYLADHQDYNHDGATEYDKQLDYNVRVSRNTIL